MGFNSAFKGLNSTKLSVCAD